MISHWMNLSSTDEITLEMMQKNILMTCLGRFFCFLLGSVEWDATHSLLADVPIYVPEMCDHILVISPYCRRSESMSQLSEILNSSQITKHYELLQFLSTHANTEYTLAQLDYLIPRGASLQRFPDAWVEFMESGLSSNRSIEVLRRGATRSSGLSSEDAENQEELILVCRRPEIRSLEELENLLQSPSTLPDVEACVALHTEQVILTESLLRAAQRRGLLYYFPDSYTKSRDRNRMKGKRGLSARGEALNLFLRSEEEESVLGLGDGQAGRLELPVGIGAQFMLYTRRGVPVRGKNSIPTTLNVGERVMVIFEKSFNSTMSTNGTLEKAPVVRAVLGQQTGAHGGAAPPIDVRVKVSSNQSASAASEGMRAYMMVRAQISGRVALSLFIDERETILQMEVVDECTTMPGTLVGRGQQPSLLPPVSIRINDPAIWRNCGDESEGHKAPTAPEEPSQQANLMAPSWWLNPSPAVLQVRDLTLPDSEATTAASRIVWIPHKRDEEAMKTIRDVLRRQNLLEAERRKRKRRQRARELRNCHMIHFGFDASVPFSRESH